MGVLAPHDRAFSPLKCWCLFLGKLLYSGFATVSPISRTAQLAWISGAFVVIELAHAPNSVAKEEDNAKLCYLSHKSRFPRHGNAGNATLCTLQLLQGHGPDKLCTTSQAISGKR